MVRETGTRSGSSIGRAARIGAQLLLVLVTGALILAIWLPALVGPSEAKQKRDQRQWPRSPW